MKSQINNKNRENNRVPCTQLAAHALGEKTIFIWQLLTWQSLLWQFLSYLHFFWQFLFGHFFNLAIFDLTIFHFSFGYYFAFR